MKPGASRYLWGTESLFSDDIQSLTNGIMSEVSSILLITCLEVVMWFYRQIRGLKGPVSIVLQGPVVAAVCQYDESFWGRWSIAWCACVFHNFRRFSRIWQTTGFTNCTLFQFLPIVQRGVLVVAVQTLVVWSMPNEWSTLGFWAESGPGYDFMSRSIQGICWWIEITCSQRPCFKDKCDIHALSCLTEWSYCCCWSFVECCAARFHQMACDSPERPLGVSNDCERMSREIACWDWADAR